MLREAIQRALREADQPPPRDVRDALPVVREASPREARDGRDVRDVREERDTRAGDIPPPPPPPPEGDGAALMQTGTSRKRDREPDDGDRNRPRRGQVTKGLRRRRRFMRR